MRSVLTMNKPQTMAGARWHEMALVLLAVVALSWPLQRGGGDFWIADHLFAWQGGQWAARDAWWAAQLLHTGVRRLAIACWLLTALTWWAGTRGRIAPNWRSPLAYLAVTLLVSTVLLTLLKRYSGVDCPWDLVRYGGSRAYLPPFSGITADASPGACFPASHAGVGYAWVATVFALARVRPAWCGRALATSLAIGFLFGLVQQLRGAHFLSHDLWSLALCWLTAAVMARCWSWPPPACTAERAARVHVGEELTP